MQESNDRVVTIPVLSRDVLTEILRDGAQRLLSQAIDAEVDAWIECHAGLYLKGISTGDFGEALQALVGPQAASLSATTITRLMTNWQDEYQTWHRRSLEGKHYVYVWADGIHFNIRLRHRRTKGNGSRVACLAMVFKLCESAANHWRLLNGATRLQEVIAGMKFINGEKAERNAA